MVDSWHCPDRVVPEVMSHVARQLEVGNHKQRTLNTRLSSGTSAGTFAVSTGPYINFRDEAGTKNEPDIFLYISKKGSENRSSRFEPKISWISFSRGSGPPLKEVETHVWNWRTGYHICLYLCFQRLLLPAADPFGFLSRIFELGSFISSTPFVPQPVWIVDLVTAYFISHKVKLDYYVTIKNQKQKRSQIGKKETWKNFFLFVCLLE